MNQLKLVYDFTQNSLPTDLMNLFSFSSDVHTVHRELNSTVNKLIYIPRVFTTTYGIDSIRYHCATLWNKFFKNGEIKIDEDKKNNVKLSTIKNKKRFNGILKKHFLHSYTIVPTVVFYWNSFRGVSIQTSSHSISSFAIHHIPWPLTLPHPPLNSFPAFPFLDSK